MTSARCVYCGKPSNSNRDHVPSKQFFPSPRPSDLVTVPSCISCNERFKQDEDLFRSTFLFGPGGATPAGRALWDQKLRRAYEKDLGFRSAIAAALAERDVATPAGISLGKHMTVEIDGPRTMRVEVRARPFLLRSGQHARPGAPHPHIRGYSTIRAHPGLGTGWPQRRDAFLARHLRIQVWCCARCP